MTRRSVIAESLRRMIPTRGSARVIYSGSRGGKECGSRASARRLMPSSVRVNSQVPISPLVIGKKRTFAGDQLFHEQGGLGTFAREASNLFQMPMVVEHIRKDHSIPGREGHL